MKGAGPTQIKEVVSRINELTGGSLAMSNWPQEPTRVKIVHGGDWPSSVGHPFVHPCLTNHELHKWLLAFEAGIKFGFASPTITRLQKEGR